MQYQAKSITEKMILDTEASVMANFEFLAHTDIDMEEEEPEMDEIYDTNAEQEQNKVRSNFSGLINLRKLSFRSWSQKSDDRVH